MWLGLIEEKGINMGVAPIPGMTVHEMLAQVQYFPNDLNRRMSELVRKKIDSDAIRPNVGMKISIVPWS